MSSVGRWVKGALLLGIGGLLSGRILVTALAEDYALREDRAARAGALVWRAAHPEALYQQAAAREASESAAAARLLQAAAWADPTDARTYVALAEWWGMEPTRQATADALMEQADALGPVRSEILAHSADYWRGRYRLDRMIARWSRLLVTQPAVSRALYPALLAFAEDPQQRELLRPLLDQPPAWWDQFFVYAARAARQADVVVFLYRQRQRGDQPPADLEQQAYLDRLWREARWEEAYQAWQMGLNERQRRALDRIYNGGFELPPTHVGFDWRMASPHGARVETASTYGARGERALHVSFNGQRVRFQHVQQFLALAPGHYRLRGRVRPDSLRTTLGLQWNVRCVTQEGPLLAESERFLGSDEWRLFTVDFTVPDTECPAQLLRLELEGRAALDYEVEGEIWFDDLVIIEKAEG